jgi:hypothetical protein
MGFLSCLWLLSTAVSTGQPKAELFRQPSSLLVQQIESSGLLEDHSRDQFY